MNNIQCLFICVTYLKVICKSKQVGRNIPPLTFVAFQLKIKESMPPSV